MVNLLELILSGLMEGSIYSLLGLGMSLIIGVMRIINSAHGDLMVFAAFVSFWLFSLLGLDPFVSLLITFPLLYILGMGIQALLVSPAIKRAEHQLVASMILTYGFALALVQSEFLVWSADYRAIDVKYFGSTTVSIAGADFNIVRVVSLIATMVTALILYLISSKTLYGKVMRATRDNREGAQLMGVNFGKVAMNTFGLSSALAAIAGMLYITTHVMNPAQGLAFTTKAYVVLILGGLGSVMGSLVAGLFLGVAENLGSYYIGGSYKDLVGYVILLVIVSLKPAGIFGKTEV